MIEKTEKKNDNDSILFKFSLNNSYLYKLRQKILNYQSHVKKY